MLQLHKHLLNYKKYVPDKIQFTWNFGKKVDFLKKINLS